MCHIRFTHTTSPINAKTASEAGPLRGPRRFLLSIYVFIVPGFHRFASIPGPQRRFRLRVRLTRDGLGSVSDARVSRRAAHDGVDGAELWTSGVMYGAVRGGREARVRLRLRHDGDE